MRCHASHFIILSLCVVSCAAWAQSTGTITVQVNVPGGSPSGLVVVASLSVPDTAAGFSGQRAFASVTNASGQASFTGLPFGVYSVCVEPRNGTLIEPCLWAPPDTTHLTSQHASDSLNLTVSKGIPVDIRIDDPEGLLSAPNAGQGLAVGIVTPIGPVPLRPAAQDPAGVNYRIIAPPSVAAAIQIAAGALQIFDNTGNSVNFFPSSTSAGPSFNLSPTPTGQFFRYRLHKSQ